jgi:hypothetical protein
LEAIAIGLSVYLSKNTSPEAAYGVGFAIGVLILFMAPFLALVISLLFGGTAQVAGVLKQNRDDWYKMFKSLEIITIIVAVLSLFFMFPAHSAAEIVTHTMLSVCLLLFAALNFIIAIIYDNKDKAQRWHVLFSILGSAVIVFLVFA